MTTKTSLLSTKEQLICSKISTLKTMEGKRAKALICLNDGDTQTATAEKSGLSYGQVKYLLSVFRKKGLSIFPEMKVTEKKPKKQKVEKPEKTKPKKEKKMKKKDKKEKKKKQDKKSKKVKDKKSKKKKSKKTKKK